MASKLYSLSLASIAIFPLSVAMAADGDARRPQLITDRAVIATNPSPDFSFAGYGFGVAPIPSDPGTVVNVTDHGVVPDDNKDDAKAILKALAAADQVQGRVTIRFPKGRIQIGEIIPIERSNIVLEGAGQDKDGTEFYFPRPLKIVDTSDRENELREYLKREAKYQVEPDQNINFLFTEYSWSGGFILIGPKKYRAASYLSEHDKRDAVLAQALAGKQFDRQLTVTDTAKLKVGQVVQLQWFATAAENSPILKSIYGDISGWNAKQTDPKMKMNIGQRHWESSKRPTVAQATRITAIKGKTITLGDPLLHDVSTSQPAVLADWQHLANVGVQNIRFTFPYSPWFGHHLEQGYNAIYMTSVFDGWARNLTIENSDSGILTDNVASITIANVTTTGNHKAHYSVHVGAAHNVLVQDLRVENPVIHPLSVNTRSTRSVYQRATVLRDGIIDQHSGSNHQNLFDQIVMNVKPKKVDGAWSYPLWVAGGAPYWKPGHGLMNTHWNIRLNVEDGLAEGQTIRVFSGLEGPGARIVGLHSNRQLEVDYKPDAYIEGTNQPVSAVPSLYDYQLAKRRKLAR
jgi:Pectate lyase superfamily protein